MPDLCRRLPAGVDAAVACDGGSTAEVHGATNIDGSAGFDGAAGDGAAGDGAAGDGAAGDGAASDGAADGDIFITIVDCRAVKSRRRATCAEKSVYEMRTSLPPASSIKTTTLRCRRRRRGVEMAPGTASNILAHRRWIRSHRIVAMGCAYACSYCLRLWAAPMPVAIACAYCLQLLPAPMGCPRRSSTGCPRSAGSCSGRRQRSPRTDRSLRGALDISTKFRASVQNVCVCTGGRKGQHICTAPVIAALPAQTPSGAPRAASSASMRRPIVVRNLGSGSGAMSS
eukprot:SAG31_NODE_5227_length_2662_cov_3.874756_3_plen_285_part_00